MSATTITLLLLLAASLVAVAEIWSCHRHSQPIETARGRSSTLLLSRTDDRTWCLYANGKLIRVFHDGEQAMHAYLSTMGQVCAKED